MVASEKEAFEEYKEAFVRDFSGPYAVQWPGKPWKTKHKPLSDPVIRAHLDQRYWVATKAPWYPRFAYADLDNPTEETLDRVIGALGLSSGQYCLCTSPSYKETGNLHLIFAPRYKDRPATKKLIQDVLKRRIEKAGAELYPQTARKFRLPFGRDQHLLDAEIGAPLPYGWKEALYWVLKLDPLPLEELPHQIELDLQLPRRPREWTRRQEAEELLREGLPGPGTRHDACLTLAIYLFRLNWTPEEARAKIKRWIRAKHNSYSKEVNRGNWGLVDREIDEIVGWVWENYGRGLIYPDTTHNLEGWVAPQDLRFIAEVFPGDIVNQRRLFKLICYYRPRSYYSWVYIPRWKWWEIADHRSYTAFRANLEGRGLLESTHSYQVGRFSKRFRLHLPPASLSERLEEDHRAIHDFVEAALMVFKSPRAVREVFRVRRDTLWRLLHEKR